MILRGVLVALGFAAGLGLLIWRVVRIEMAIMQDTEHELVALKTYPTGHDSYTIDEMLLRASGVPFVTRGYGRGRAGYTTICVTRAVLEKARSALGKAQVG